MKHTEEGIKIAINNHTLRGIGMHSANADNFIALSIVVFQFFLSRISKMQHKKAIDNSMTESSETTTIIVATTHTENDDNIRKYRCKSWTSGSVCRKSPNIFWRYNIMKPIHDLLSTLVVLIIL